MYCTLLKCTDSLIRSEMLLIRVLCLYETISPLVIRFSTIVINLLKFSIKVSTESLVTRT